MLFNNSGEINAIDTRDALAQVVKYATLLQNNQSSSQNLVGQPSFTDEQKDNFIRQALMSPEGKVALGQAMANPIRRK